MDNQPYQLEAIHLLGQAGIKVIDSDVALLALDIAGVAEELNGDGEHSEQAYDGAMELKNCIGGLRNLASYMRCLRVPKKA